VIQYTIQAKRGFCRRLDQDWPDLADLCQIPRHTIAKFPRGEEPRHVWDHLEVREQLHWLEDFLAEIGRADLADLLREGRVAPASPTRVEIDVVSTVTFDLTEIKRRIMRTLEERIAGIVAFAVPYGDGFFVTNLCDYLASFVDGTARKPSFGLNAEMPPARIVPSIAAYREELDSADLVVPIGADRADSEMLGDFLTQLSGAIGDLPRRLILLLCVAPDFAPMDGVCELGRPDVAREDIRDWLQIRQDALSSHAKQRIPASAIDRWAYLVAERGADGFDGLDFRGVLDGFESTLRKFRADPDRFLLSLTKEG